MRIGLIEGRHQMPVEGYLLPANAADLYGYHGILYSAAFNAAIELPGYVELVLTGLTIAAIGAADGLRARGEPFALVNYDRESNSYIVIQPM